MDFIKGTEGKQDYALIAKNGVVGLALKVELMRNAQNMNQLMAHVVFRSVFLETPGVDSAERAKMLSDAWPNVKFSQVNDERASYHWWVPMEAQGVSEDELDAKVHEVLETVVLSAMKRVEGAVFVHVDEIKGHVKATQIQMLEGGDSMSEGLSTEASDPLQSFLSKKTTVH